MINFVKGISYFKIYFYICINHYVHIIYIIEPLKFKNIPCSYIKFFLTSVQKAGLRAYDFYANMVKIGMTYYENDF